MKKILGIILILMLIAVPAVEARRQIVTTAVKLNSNNRTINNYLLRTGVEYLTNPISTHDSYNTGVLLISNESGSAFDIDISYQVSEDGVNFFTPLLSSSLSGNHSTDQTIAIGVNANRYIEFTHQMAKFIRFQFDPDAESEVTIIYIQQVGD